MVNIILIYPRATMKVLLFIALLLVLAHSYSPCLEKGCPNEMYNCDDDCLNVVAPCSIKCNWNQYVD
jgi:hypothetical protein